jgi:hypothetical protein
MYIHSHASSKLLRIGGDVFVRFVKPKAAGTLCKLRTLIHFSQGTWVSFLVT